MSEQRDGFATSWGNFNCFPRSTCSCQSGALWRRPFTVFEPAWGLSAALMKEIFFFGAHGYLLVLMATILRNGFELPSLPFISFSRLLCFAPWTLQWGSPLIQEKWYKEAHKLIECILVNWRSSSTCESPYVGKIHNCFLTISFLKIQQRCTRSYICHLHQIVDPNPLQMLCCNIYTLKYTKQANHTGNKREIRNLFG